jgi:hypothetical protein
LSFLPEVRTASISALRLDFDFDFEAFGFALEAFGFFLDFEAFGFGSSFGGSTSKTNFDNEAKASIASTFFEGVGLNIRLFTAFLVAFSNSEWEMVFAITVRY